MRSFSLLLLGAMLGASLSPLSAAPAPAAGGKGVILPFPAKSQLVVQVNGFEQSRDRLEKLITAAAPLEAPQAKKAIRQGIEQLLGERKMTAIPADGRWYLAIQDFSKLAPSDDDGPSFAVLIPVTEAKAFRESFLTSDEQKSYKKGEAGIASFTGEFQGEQANLYLVEQPGYVILSPSKETAELYAGKYDKATTDTLGADVSKSLLESDVSLYVNMDAVNDQFGQQIQTARQLLDFAIAQGAGQGGVSKKQLDAAKVMFKGMFQGIEDAQAVVVGAEFRPSGLAFRILGKFEGDTLTGKLLRNEELTPLADIGKLPSGQMMYVGGRLSRAIMEPLKDLVQQVNAAEDDDKSAKAITDYIDAIQAAGPIGTYQAASMPVTSLQVQTFKDPAKAVAAETAMFKALAAGSSMQNVQLKEKPKVTEKAHTLESFTFNELKLVFDYEATVKELPEQLKEATIASMKKMMGETMTIFYGTDGKVMITAAAKDWDAAKGLISDYLAGKTTLSQSAGFKLTRENLPAQTSLMAVMDVGKVIVFMASYIQTMADQIPGFPANIPELKPAKGDPVYFGASLTLKPEVIQADLFVPASAAMVVQKILAPLLQKIE